MTKNELLNEYQNNEELLLKKWYAYSIAEEREISIDDVEYKTIPFLSEELKEKFLLWVTNNRTRLHKIICIDFNYIEKKEKYESTTDILIMLSDFLSSEYTASLEIAILLSKTVLDELCL